MPMLEDAEGIEDFTARASSNAKDHFVNLRFQSKSNHHKQTPYAEGKGIGIHHTILCKPL